MLVAQLLQDAISLAALGGLIWYVLVLRTQNSHTRQLVDHAATQALQATEQVKQLSDESLRATQARLATVSQNVSMQMHDINRLFVDRPELKKYFYESAPLSKGDADHDRAMCIAEMIVDFMDNVLTQAPLLEGELSDAWRGYFEWVYQSSPIVRGYWDRHSDWYAAGLHDLFAQAQ